MSVTTTKFRVGFGLYEVDLQTGELRKAGFRVKIQSQPFKVLAMLLEHPGQIVTREELQLRLWGPDTVVDFDHSLGTAINKIREALGDSADNPRFVETLARRGYRFIAPVHALDLPGEPQASLAEEPVAAVPLAVPGAWMPWSHAVPAGIERRDARASIAALQGSRGVSWGQAALAAAILSVMAAACAYVAGRTQPAVPEHLVQLTHNGHLAAGVMTMDNLAAAVTDGVYIYATTYDHGRAGISAISVSDGTVSPLAVPEDVAGPALGDISPDGSRLLLRDHLSPEAEQPLWIVSTLGGSAQRVGNVLAHDATWMPDGKSVLFANGNQLFITGTNGIGSSVFARLPGRAFWLRWSPNGRLLRFTITDPQAHTLTLWQLADADRKPERILTGFRNPASECCGIWMNGGKQFVFQSSRGGSSDLWRMDGNATSGAVRVTDGPLQFEAPVAARSGSQVFFVGADSRSELDRLTPTGTLTAVTGFLADAERVDYSRDSKWVAWTDTSGRLWRSLADGSERLQISPDNLNVFLAHWSPDAQHLAIMARQPGEAWRIYVVNADGSGLRQLLNEQRNAADPSWSADGNTLVFGRTNDRMGQEAARSLEVVDVRTGAVTEVPGSDGFFSPRWSPDGRYIVALSLDQRHVMLYDVAAKTWRPLPVLSGADPVWAPDSKAVLLHGALNSAQPIDSISIPEGKVTELAELANHPATSAVDYVFCGIDAEGTPLIRVRSYTGDLFSVNLQK
jgi:Tol biopolymer transport system component/DNA-binding winged helix-turn-helix (wHTH) protein